MVQPQPFSNMLDVQTMIDSMGQGVLVFDSHDTLVMDNAAARTLLGANLVLVRAEGWRAAAMLLDAAQTDTLSADQARDKAFRQAQPVRFNTFLGGAYTPCWASALYSADGQPYTMIAIEHPDWSALTELMNRFRTEARMSITSTRGHAELIKQIIANLKPTTTADHLAQQVSGFAAIMSTHMFRLEMLVEQLQRLEDIRTGELLCIVRHNRRTINLLDFLEDFLEDILDSPLVEELDPEHDYRDQIRLDVPGHIDLYACKDYVTYAFRDLLRNSVMYSKPRAPITIRAAASQRSRATQIDIIDEGCGIRAKEVSRVFTPFMRARQPQVIAEFGYGVSLYLVKMELEAQGGGIWFTSEEGVGTTFSFKLPLARNDAD